MLANPDTKKCVGIKIASPRQGHFGQMCRHLAVGATCCRHVGDFLSQGHHFLSDSTDYCQRIACADTPFVPAAAAPLPLSPTPLLPPFLPWQPPLLKISNQQAGWHQRRMIAAHTMVKSVGSGRSTFLYSRLNFI